MENLKKQPEEKNTDYPCRSDRLPADFSKATTKGRIQWNTFNILPT